MLQKRPMISFTQTIPFEWNENYDISMLLLLHSTPVGDKDWR